MAIHHVFTSQLCILFVYFTCGAANPCRYDWIQFEESCYGFGETNFSWPEADDFCRAAGARLAEIETAEENEFIKQEAGQRKGHHYWLGGTDVFHEGTWSWISTGALFTFTDWHQSNPDDYLGHEDCLTLPQSYNYQWNDAPCDWLYLFICEAPADETVVG